MPFTISPDVLQALQTIGTLLAVYYGVFSLGLAIWTFQDIRRRTQYWPVYFLALSLVVVFNLPGFLIYLLVRPQQTMAQQYENSLEEAMILQDLGKQLACPRCKRAVEDEFLICPFCRTQLRRPCGHCGHPLNALWKACPYCTTPVPVEVADAAATAVTLDATADRPSTPPPAERSSAPRGG